MLYIIKKALFELYKAFRFFLVRTAYAIPFTDELTDTIAGSVSAISLWTVPRRWAAPFPIEEVPSPERTQFFTSYAPWVPPFSMPEVQALGANFIELPATWPGPYAAGATPDGFTDRPLGLRDMLAASGPVNIASLPNPPVAFDDFGGAMANCTEAFKRVKTALKANNLTPGFFPDYNLDGDRGYAWPCWDIVRPPSGPGSIGDIDPAGQPAPVTVSATVIT